MIPLPSSEVKSNVTPIARLEKPEKKARAPLRFKPKACRICGVQFQPTSGMHCYCSRECAREGQMITFVCAFCGETTRKIKQYASTQRFCSPACSVRATASMRAEKLRQPTLWKDCAFCKEPFEIRDRSRDQRFCSRRCLGFSRRRIGPVGRRNPKEWGLKKKGESACRNCGAPASHLHHIVPRSKTRRGHSEIVANGLPLCYDCHRGWHDRIVAIPHRVMTDEEFGFAVAVAGGFWVERNYSDEPLVAFHRLDEVIRHKYVFGRPEAFDERLERVGGLGLIECWAEAMA